MAAVASDLSVIDVDAHITEPHDLWTARAPASLKDRVPQVKGTGAERAWIVDGDIQLQTAIPTSVIARDGSKSRGTEFFGWQIEDVHLASYDMKARVEVMDQSGLYAQILYPNVAGFGSQNFMKVEDAGLRLSCAQIYNEAMAEIQADSNDRLLPMALMPWWNIEQSVAELERAKQMGLRGIVMCSDPDSVGLPDLGDPAWLPFWEAADAADMPINFHIGASETSFNMFGRAAWASNGMRRRLALGSAALFIENSRVIANMIYSGVFDRCPNLKCVSVESGIGWIPFVLEALDYEWHETGSQQEQPLQKEPSEYFRDHFWGCFWFERIAPTALIDVVGEDNVMFETDFPHPTCLYPDVQEYIAEISADWSDERKRKIFEGGIHVPYMLRWPARVAPGRRYGEAVHHFDIFATAAAAAGAEIPGDRKVDGVDLLPYVRGEAEGTPHETLFWTQDHYRVVRHQGWKLQRSGPNDELVWLFDLNTDPTEQRNLAGERHDKVAELDAILAGHLAEQAPPRWPSRAATAISIDKHLNQPESPDDEFVYYPN